MKYAALRHMKCTTGFPPKSSVHEISTHPCAWVDMLEPAPPRRLLYRWEDRCWVYLVLDFWIHLPKRKNPRIRGFFLSIGWIFCILNSGVTHNGGMTFSSWCSNSHPVNGEGGILLPSPRGGGDGMITYGELMQFCEMIIDLISLVLFARLTKKK